MPAMWQAELRGIHIFSVMLLNQTFFVLYLFFDAIHFRLLFIIFVFESRKKESTRCSGILEASLDSMAIPVVRISFVILTK